MKKIFTLILSVTLLQVGHAQPAFKQLLETINWSATEAEFVNQWKSDIVKTDVFHNEEGRFTREYILKGVELGDYKLDFYINVHEDTKTLKFVGADFPSDVQFTTAMDQLTALYGQPNTIKEILGKEATWYTANGKVVLRNFFQTCGVNVYPNKAIVINPNSLHKRFELYPTENNWTFLELDTVYGLVSVVQFSVKDDNNTFKRSLSFDDLREGSAISVDEYIPGRFELHSTKNFYNFILLDTVDGRTWQMQWTIDGDNEFVQPILQY